MNDKTRRQFLQTALATTTLAGTPVIFSRQAFAARDINSKPTVAAIGVGGSRGAYSRGGKIARNAAKFGKMIACCDVDDLHTGEFNADFENKLSLYRDYRKLFENETPDIVTIGTPDHWHVPIATAALQAGCDVYCEKPLTLTIAEGIEICKTVNETGRVFQVGTQQRSECGAYFLKAIAIAQSGRLGGNLKAYVAIGGAPSGGPFGATDPPADLDWNLWLGPAPEADYSSERRRMFRWWFEYSGGKMTDWGAHHIDIAQWALGCNHTGPVKVSGTGQFPPLVPDDFAWDAFLDGATPLPNGYNTPTQFSIDLTFGNGTVLNVNHHYQGEDGKTAFGNGLLLEGDQGRIFVNRNRLSGLPVEQMTTADHAQMDELVLELYQGKTPGNHMANFFESVEERTQPISDVATHHRTMTSCHLCNIALMLGRDLQWDPAKETFIGDDQATALISRKRRRGF